jgi:virginiamycin B lyase
MSIIPSLKKGLFSSLSAIVACVSLLFTSPPRNVMGSTRAVSVSNAATVMEFTLPTSNHYIASITSGPDGALWFTAGKESSSGNFIGRITTDGTVTEYPIDSLPGYFRDVTVGSDGNFWFTVSDFKIGRMTPSGVVTEFSIPPTSYGSTFHITAGPDGALWFTELLGNRIGRITTTGVITEFDLPSFVPPLGVRPTAITAGPDGNIWFAELLTGIVGKITPLGVITEFPATGGEPIDMTVGPDGALWFTMSSAGAIGRMTTSGQYTSFPVSETARPYAITAGPDGALWFTDEFQSRVSRITTGGQVTHFSFLTNGGGSRGITAGPDGNIWFVESLNNKIGKVVLSSFDTCLQDDSSSNQLQINTTTGEYQFTNCSATTLGGVGTLIKKGSTITLQHNAADRRVTAKINGTKKATSSVQIFSSGMTFTITDKNMTNNTCACSTN